MFSKNFQKEIDHNWINRIGIPDQKRNEIEETLATCDANTTYVMKLFLSTMPFSDIGSIDLKILLDYAKHGIYLWENYENVRLQPLDIFVNYVLHYRVNEEEIRTCRPFFYEKLKDRMKGKKGIPAILEVNEWCAEEATYQATDERTISAIAVFNGAFGRCGEESTFTVSALRSLGIPARQVYAPRWSHSDDNHAWVEVWNDGTWYYLGACEPEEVLNRGWFTKAASRAMLIHSRVFTDLIPAGEEIIGKDGNVTILNHLSRYAITKKVCIHVVDEKKQPVANAKVDFEVFNYSELYPVASVITDEHGTAAFTTGMGSLHIHASKNGRYNGMFLDISGLDSENETTELCKEIQLIDQDQNLDKGWIAFDMKAPKDAAISKSILTKEQKAITKEKKVKANAVRANKIEHFYNNGDLQKLMAFWSNLSGGESDQKLLEEFLSLARGNAHSVIVFLETRIDEIKDNDERKLKLALLQSLSIKDYRDLQPEILLDHLRNAIPYKDQYPEDIYNSFVLCPRIEFEQMSSYRSFILDHFTPEQKTAFQKDPQSIWSYIEKEITERADQEYQNLITIPVAALKTKSGSNKSKRILFLTICRTLGIPARMNLQDGTMEYYQKERFISLSSKNEWVGTLKLSARDDSNNWMAQQNWTLGRLEHGCYKTLQINPEVVQVDDTKQTDVILEPGQYRILTANRLPSGDLYGKEYTFILEEGMVKEVQLDLRDVPMQDMLVNLELEDFILKDSNGNDVVAKTLLEQGTHLTVWLSASEEPTEHILNELYERSAEFKTADIKIHFVLKDPSEESDPTFMRTLKTLGPVSIYYDPSWDTSEPISRRMYVDPDKLPLILTTYNGLQGIYACSGYNVGTADMLLKIFKYMK